jgi:pilus assembly protein Flp/PilA
MYALFIAFQDLLVRVLRQDDRGATAVEYGLILVFIAAVIVAAVTSVGTHVAKAFTTIGGDF